MQRFPRFGLANNLLMTNKRNCEKLKSRDALDTLSISIQHPDTKLNLQIYVRYRGPGVALVAV